MICRVMSRKSLTFSQHRVEKMNLMIFQWSHCLLLVGTIYMLTNQNSDKTLRIISTLNPGNCFISLKQTFISTDYGPGTIQM